MSQFGKFINFRLPADLDAALRAAADREGLPTITYAKMIVRNHARELMQEQGREDVA